MANQRQLEARFNELGINSRSPEFYNDPAFVAEEKRNPKFLWDYSDYVIRRTYSTEYQQKARSAVPQIVRYLFDALVEDGRLGACLDASLAACKILEKYGFWNTVQTGSLTAVMPSAATRKTRHWAELMLPDNPAKIGHAWLIVPPFRVVDLTVTRQPQNKDMRTLISPYIVATETTEVEGVSIDDMLDADLQAWYLKTNGQLPTIHEIMKVVVPQFAEHMTRFRPFAVQDGTSTLKYFPCRPTLPEEPFENHTGHCFSGRRTPELFRDLVAAIGPPDDIGCMTRN